MAFGSLSNSSRNFWKVVTKNRDGNDLPAVREAVQRGREDPADQQRHEDRHGAPSDVLFTDEAPRHLPRLIDGVGVDRAQEDDEEERVAPTAQRKET